MAFSALLHRGAAKDAANAKPTDGDAAMSSIRDPGRARPAAALTVPGRRQVLALGALAALSAAPRVTAQPDTVAALLRAGGALIAFRHALAPGTFDPPEFRLGDCSTQRNLDAVGREQARRIGQWFAARALVPRQVLSSPWCRCIDTAQLAFGGARVEPALGSPHGAPADERAASLRRLRAALAAARARPAGVEVWVTHMFVLADLTAEGSSPGEGLVLAPGNGDGPARVLARLAIPA
jgi:hypothetical protein